jgi:hypothetical protein
MNVKNNTFTTNGEMNSWNMYLFIKDVIFISSIETGTAWWECHSWPYRQKRLAGSDVKPKFSDCHFSTEATRFRS